MFRWSETSGVVSLSPSRSTCPVSETFPVALDSGSHPAGKSAATRARSAFASTVTEPQARRHDDGDSAPAPPITRLGADTSIAATPAASAWTFPATLRPSIDASTLAERSLTPCTVARSSATDAVPLAAPRRQVHVDVERGLPRLHALLEAREPGDAREVEPLGVREHLERAAAEARRDRRRVPEPRDPPALHAHPAAGEADRVRRHERTLPAARQRGAHVVDGDAAREAHVGARVEVGRVGAAGEQGDVRVVLRTVGARRHGHEVHAARDDAAAGEAPP